MKRTGLAGAGRVLALLILGAIGLAAVVQAQTTTGTLRGTVKDETGAVRPDTSVEAVNEDTGFRSSTPTQGNGFYNLSVPPGNYTVTATAPNFAPETKKVRVLLGDIEALDFTLKVGARTEQAVTVSAEAPTIETKSNEIATNVSREQIEHLPQSSRNFLNFAALAPGVRISDSAGTSNSNDVHINAAGSDAENINVFIDGTSYKNDILKGGVVGQDSSRGNPFPQGAIQEFRVLSQNYKAEYEEASTAIITAITKSGGNRISGDAFVYYQNKSLVAQDPFAPAGSAKPDYTRYQAGFDLGGPIIQDRLHYFGTFELNNQNRSSVVSLGPQASQAPAALQQQLAAFTGQFGSPFREDLALAKLSWQALPNSLLDFSGNWRHETDIKDFGQQTSFQSADNIKQDIWNIQGKYTMSGSRFVSESTLSYLSYQWNQLPTNTDLIGLNYDQILRIGGRDTTQDFHQKRFAVREDFSLLGVQAAGDHVMKMGLILNFNKYDVSKKFNENPLFTFRSDIGNFSFPFEAAYGVGNPDLSANNNQYGIYVQDDWSVNANLTVNIGLRWDYETNALNNSYATPANVRSELLGLTAVGNGIVGPEFFTDGTQRPTYKNEFQPRIGFAYDVTGKGQTVLFAGYGRYYDRNGYNNGLDERFRLQHQVLTFRFSADGLPRPEGPTIMWDPSFLSVAGLNGLIASGAAPKPDVFLVNNNTKPPVNDQFSAGIRQAFGPIATSISYAGIRGRDGFTFIRGNRNPDGTCCHNPVSTSFGNLFLSDASKRFWYDALYLTIDKPYTPTSKWGASVAYTWAHSTQTGNDLFTFDFVNVSSSPRHSTPNDERHRVVLSGMVGLPFDVRASTLLTLGSGLPYTIADAHKGFGINEVRIELNEGRQPGTFPYQSWDLRLQKDFLVSGAGRFGVVAEVFNLTNHHNYGCFDGFIAKLPEINAHFGKPGCIVTDGRRAQFGVNVGF